MIPNERNNFEDIDKELNKFLIWMIGLLFLALTIAIILYAEARNEISSDACKENVILPTHEACIGCEPVKKECL